MYKQAKVVDPLAPDKPGFKPSDHKIVILYPVDNLNEIRKSEYTMKIARPLPESRVASLVKELVELTLIILIESLTQTKQIHYS